MDRQTDAIKRWCEALQRAGYNSAGAVTFHCSQLLCPRGDRKAAESAYRALLTDLPEHKQGLEGMAFLLQLQGRTAEAVPYRERLLRLHIQSFEIDDSDQEVATRYLLAAEGGAAQPGRAPSAYVRGLFDGYARYFDGHLRDKLHYRGPELLYESLKGILDLKTSRLDVLDIGCGTGLAGVRFRPVANRLDGIDLSASMLEKAAQRRIYDRLEQGEILTRLPQMEQRYDLLVAADVLIYFGDLSVVFRAMSTVLRDAALAVFSVEKGETAGYRLRSTGRYQHHPDYVREVARRQGFEILSCQEKAIRRQDNRPVVCTLFVMRRPSNARP